MKKLILRMSLTAFALAVGPYLIFARTQPCGGVVGGLGNDGNVAYTWTVSGGNCCAPQANYDYNYGTMTVVYHGSVSTSLISVAEAQQRSGCPIGIYRPQ